MNNLAQHLRLCHRFVILRKRIPSRDPSRLALLDQPMNKKPPLSRNQHDVSGNDLFRPTLDAENIARPDRRKHAVSERLQAYAAARAENFHRKIELMIVASLAHHCHGRCYELFRLKRHCSSVGLTLPQAKAMVSKTRSYRNSGF